MQFPLENILVSHLNPVQEVLNVGLSVLHEVVGHSTKDIATLGAERTVANMDGSLGLRVL